MPYDQPFAADDGLPDFDPRQATKDLQLQRMTREAQENPFALGQAAEGPPGRPGGPYRGEIKNPAPRPQDPLTPVYEALSPANQGYSIGQAVGETVKAPTLWEKAQAAFPLVAGMAVPGAPKGGPRGVKVRPEIPRELDSLGYYSQALEAAKAWPQPKGTPEQALKMLEQAQVKKAEIEATGVRPFLEGKPHVTRDELVQHLRDNRVQLQEGKYGGHATVDENGETLFHVAKDGMKEPKWADYSLDPSNPTYRETVIHLPATALPSFERWFAETQQWNQVRTEAEARATYERGKVGNSADFLGGHWSEPNVIAHARTSMQKDAQGKPVFLVDELQSDWGQKLRDGGARDEAKIAELEKRYDEADAAINAMPQQRRELRQEVADHLNLHSLVNEAPTDAHFHKMMNDERLPPELRQKIDDHFEGLVEGKETRRLIGAELQTAKASTPGHPLVNTTDQWTTTAMRRLLQQANASGAEGIALTPGQLQNERFNLARHVSALRWSPDTEGLHYRQPNAAGRIPSGNDPWYSAKTVTKEELPGYLGKEVAERLLQQPLQPFDGGGNYMAHHLEQLGTHEIGGHGMRYAYDQMYPKKLEQMLRRLDPQHPGRGETKLLAAEQDVDGGLGYEIVGHGTPDRKAILSDPFHYFPLTQKVREEIAKGLPLFSSAALMALVPQVQPKKPEIDERAPFGYDQ